MPPAKGRAIGHAQGGRGGGRGRGGKRASKFEEEDIDDDLAFDSDDDAEFGWFFDEKDGGKAAAAKGKQKQGDASAKSKDKQSVKDEFRKLRSMDDDDDFDDEDDDDSDDSREEVDLSDMLDSKEERQAKKLERQAARGRDSTSQKASSSKKSAPAPNQRAIRGSETLAPSAMSASVETFGKGSKKASKAFSVAATSLTDLLSAAASGAPLPEATNGEENNSAAAIPSTVADRLNTLLSKKHLKIRKEKDPHVKELEDRAETRKLIKQDMKTWKPMLEELKRAKTVSYPLKIPNATAVPSTLGGLASAFQTAAKENAEAASEAAAMAAAEATTDASSASGPAKKKKKTASLSHPTDVAPDGFATPGARLAAGLAQAMREKLADSGLIEASAAPEAAARRIAQRGGKVETPFGDSGAAEDDGTYVTLDSDGNAAAAPADGPVGYVRKLKALLSYEIAKRRRFNKIKSKAYRRILRKEKERGLEKKRQAEDLLDPDRAQRRLAAKMDRARAEERVTQKHKNTSKWVKHVKRMAKFDSATKEAIQDQDAKRQELMKKMEEPAEHELEEADEDLSSSEEEDVLVDKLFNEENAGGDDGLDTLWGQHHGQKSHPAENADTHPDGTPLTAVEKSRKELFNMKFMKKERERQQRQMTSEFEQMKEDISRYNNGDTSGLVGDGAAGSSDEEGEASGRGGRSKKRRRGANRAGGSSDEDDDAKEDREAIAKDDRRAIMERISGSSRLWEREKAREDRAAQAAAQLRQQRLMQQQVTANASRQVQGFAEGGRRTFGNGAALSESTAGFTSAFALGVATQPGMVAAAVQKALPQITLPAFGGIRLAAAGGSKAASSQPAPITTSITALAAAAESHDSHFVEEGDDAIVGGEERSIPEQRKGTATTPTVATKASASPRAAAGGPKNANDEETSYQQRATRSRVVQEAATPAAALSQAPPSQEDLSTEALVTRAFAQDDIDAEFLTMKGHQVEGIMKPKDKNASLPGWGTWGGTDERLNRVHKERVAAMEHDREVEKTLLMKARADAHLDHVIINHDVDLVPGHHTLHMVPRPFANAKDFQHASRQTFGPESNTAGSFIEGVAPKIKTARGLIIDPLDKEMSIRKAPKTQRKSSVAESLSKGHSAVKKSPAPAVKK